VPAFFVHGVPETHHLWDGIRSHLSRKDIVAVDLPGFSTPVPDSFGCTKEDYLAWLIAEVEKVGEPVDIVGHDWGAALVERLVCIRSDLVRTWAAGGAAIDENHVWHNLAQMWQTPNVGEQVMASFTPEAMVAAFTAEGVSNDVATAMASRVDDRMKACILPLYRSAVNRGEEWGPGLKPIGKPGLVIWGADDPYGGQLEFAKRMAERTGAEIIVFENTSHWWPAQRPAESAAALEQLWGRA
jgi:pimeloyl-ACP methyl ester carboxylesterase